MQRLKHRVLVEDHPDYVVPVNISFGSSMIDNVECFIYLPREYSEMPLLSIRMNQADAQTLGFAHQFSLSTNSDNLRGIKIHAPIVAYRKLGKKPGESNYYVLAEPSDLTIHEYLPSANEEKTQASYLISPSTLLMPGFLSIESHTGDVNICSAQSLTVPIDQHRSVRFINHFKYFPQENENKRSSPVVVGEIISDTKYEPSALMDWMDEFMILTSFAERRRCVCLGRLEATASGITRYYRTKMAFADNAEGSYSNTLIDDLDFKDFASSARESFGNGPTARAYRQIMNVLISSIDLTIESSFIAIFSALETIVTVYATEKNNSNIIPEADFRRLRHEFGKWLKEQEYVPIEKQNMIIRKIQELNRPPLAERIRYFIENIGIVIDDLWPIFDNSNNKTSLSGIRNSLVHGGLNDRASMEALSVAGMHLRWIVERCLLRLLGWPVERSQVSERKLVQFLPYREWGKYRSGLSSNN